MRLATRLRGGAQLPKRTRSPIGQGSDVASLLRPTIDVASMLPLPGIVGHKAICSLEKLLAAGKEKETRRKEATHPRWHARLIRKVW